MRRLLGQRALLDRDRASHLLGGLGRFDLLGRLGVADAEQAELFEDLAFRVAVDADVTPTVATGREALEPALLVEEDRLWLFVGVLGEDAADHLERGHRHTLESTAFETRTGEVHALPTRRAERALFEGALLELDVANLFSAEDALREVEIRHGYALQLELAEIASGERDLISGRLSPGRQAELRPVEIEAQRVELCVLAVDQVLKETFEFGHRNTLLRDSISDELSFSLGAHRPGQKVIAHQKSSLSLLLFTIKHKRFF